MWLAHWLRKGRRAQPRRKSPKARLQIESLETRNLLASTLGLTALVLLALGKRFLPIQADLNAVYAAAQAVVQAGLRTDYLFRLANQHRGLVVAIVGSGEVQAKPLDDLVPLVHVDDDRGKGHGHRRGVRGRDPLQSRRRRGNRLVQYRRYQ